MKNKLLAFTLTTATLLTTSLSFAATDPIVCVGISPAPNIFVGPVYCGKGAMPTLTVRGGPVTMQNTVVDKTIDDSALNIAGPVNMTGVTIKGTTIINGLLIADSSNFTDTMTLGMDTLNLSASKATDINFTQITGAQNIYLKKGTEVTGSITFASGGGTVYLSDGSKVDGKVVGGKVVTG